jgi:Tfp pilus assembly protein PilX
MIYLFMTPSARTRENSIALLIVLAFLVLLAGITLAYLSRATTDRQIAHGSFNDAQSDQLARSALEIVVADFKQEVAAAGSVPTNANIGPQRSPRPAAGSTPAIPNLIRRSVRSDGIPAPAVASRASGVNSTADISRNGRAISLSRWNSHYLVPKSNTGDNGSEPITSGFSPPNYWAPDWVVVTRVGPTSFNSWNSALADSSAANNNYAIGRYAYVVYDECGLLDANLVGLPSPAPSATDIGRKGNVAFADLTAMKLTAAGSTPNPTTLSKMVAWRNYATLQSSGTFAALSPTPNPSPNFTSYFLDTSRDFQSVAPTVYNNKTDQAFLTRRQLINIFQGTGAAGSSGIGGSYNMLQFLGTFSRENNAPTWTAGTAALTERFALGNLALVRPAPIPASISDIQKYFGLRWVASTSGTSSPTVPGHWQYIGSSGTAIRDRIPAFTTNPEFFQLLNYAINGTNSDDTANIRTILSIGAAVIDQYDDSTASDPLTGTTTTMIEYNGGWAFGLENTDPGRPPASPSPFPVPAGMSPTPPPAVAGYVMLNRSFRNVGELGYAFRTSATPTATPSSPKTIDFSTAMSLDAPILDLFTYNTATVRAGTVNLNTQNPAVIAALLKGTITAEPSTSPVGLATANNAAASPTPNPNIGIIANTASGSEGTLIKPALGRKEISRLSAAAANTISSSSEEAKETVARALAEVTQTRTWGLLIDLIAQSGRYPPTASSLSDFIVEGEKRYWLHVAIDRFSGQVVDQQLEEVFE